MISEGFEKRDEGVLLRRGSAETFDITRWGVSDTESFVKIRAVLDVVHVVIGDFDKIGEASVVHVGGTDFDVAQAGDFE